MFPAYYRFCVNVWRFARPDGGGGGETALVENPLSPMKVAFVGLCGFASFRVRLCCVVEVLLCVLLCCGFGVNPGHVFSNVLLTVWDTFGQAFGSLGGLGRVVGVPWGEQMRNKYLSLKEVLAAPWGPLRRQ